MLLCEVHPVSGADMKPDLNHVWAYPIEIASQGLTKLEPLEVSNDFVLGMNVPHPLQPLPILASHRDSHFPSLPHSNCIP